MDAAPDRAAAYAAIRGLPGLDTVLTSGGFAKSGDGVAVLAAEAEREAGLGGPALLVGGGLREEALPELRKAGLGAFHVGTAVRADGTWDSPVDEVLVRRWRERLA
jgi:copper homeostasis protein